MPRDGVGAAVRLLMENPPQNPRAFDAADIETLLRNAIG